MTASHHDHVPTADCAGRVHPAVEAASWAELAGRERCHLWPLGHSLDASKCIVCGITWRDHYGQPVCPGPEA